MAAPRRRTPSRPKTDLNAFEALPLASLDDESFVDFCEEIRRRLGPRNDVEHDIAELIVHAFLGLRRAARAAEDGQAGAARYLATMLRSFRSRQRSYDLIRQIIDRGPAPTAAAPPPSEPVPPVPEAPVDAPSEPEETPGASTDPAPEADPEADLDAPPPLARPDRIGPRGRPPMAGGRPPRGRRRRCPEPPRPRPLRGRGPRPLPRPQRRGPHRLLRLRARRLPRPARAPLPR